MRVLLINSNRARDLMPAAPIGLSYVAGAVRRAGHQVRLLDLMPTRGADRDLRRAVRRFRPQVVGISVRNIDNVVRQRLRGGLDDVASRVAVLVDELRADGSEKVPIVLGGSAVSILGASALEHTGADVAICGEGEHSFPALLAALENGGDLRSIPGICFRRDGEIVCVPPRRIPAFGPSTLQDWIHWPFYERHGATWPVQTKRGCPMPCSYCTYPVIEGPEHRGRPAAEVADEIEEVVRRLAPRCVEIVDSTFNIPPEHALEVCDEIARRDLKVALTTTGINPAQTSAELFRLMKRAGFRSMGISPESASETMLRNLQKGFTREQVVRTARLAAESGLHALWLFLLGGPGETPETVEETTAFIERHLSGRRCLSVVFTGIRILPGTALARTAVGSGYLPAGADLSRPAFFQSPLVSEAEILDRLNDLIDRRPNVVHAAEGGDGVYDRIVCPLLRLGGAAPPYWRFLPRFLALPPVRWARRRRPVTAA